MTSINVLSVRNGVNEICFFTVKEYSNNFADVDTLPGLYSAVGVWVEAYSPRVRNFQNWHLCMRTK